MCGILGGIGDDSFSLVSKHLSELDHRGPDVRNVLKLENKLTLGATRLAMTDQHPRSNQPMTDQENGNSIVFNGEIYNFKKIRNLLIKKGVCFHTQSDTEVVLKGLGFIGPKIISSFEGMFAFSFYDKINNQIYLVRDFLGKKPLYYYLDSNNFYFSSRPSLVKKIMNINKLNYAAISNYLSIGYLVDPQTIYENIYAVNPGEVLKIDTINLNLKHSSLFEPDYLTKTSSLTINQSIDRAIVERTEGHDKFALSMSGGVDSTLIAQRSAQLGLNFTAYSLQWPDSDKKRYNQDAESAKKISDQLGISLQLISMPPASEVPSILKNYLLAMDEPNSNPTGLSMMALYSQMAKDGHRLALTGDGADEIFGGYERYKIAKKFNKFPQLKAGFLQKLISQDAIDSNLIAKSMWPFCSSKIDESWLYWHRIATDSHLSKLLQQHYSARFNISGLEMSQYFHSKSQKVPDLMFRDLKTWLVMESNRKLDRVSMWNSIEARSPFQSENVISSGYTEMAKFNFAKVEKEILFESFPQLHGLSINKSKMGFISPLGDWLRKNPDLIENAVNNLSNYLPINKSELEKLVKSPQKGHFANFKMLWSLIVLNGWMELNKK